MALHNCPECGRKISDKAKSCPRCGWVVDRNVLYVRQRRGCLAQICVVVIVTVCVVRFVSNPTESVNKQGGVIATISPTETDTPTRTAKPVSNYISDEALRPTTAPTATIRPDIRRDALMRIGFAQAEADAMCKIFTPIGIWSITSIEAGSGSGINQLQAFRAIANEDKQLVLTITIENRKLYYVGVNGTDLYDGKVLKNINDVHVADTEVDLMESVELSMITEDVIKQCLNHPTTAKFGLFDWGYAQEDDKYQCSGKVTAQNSFGVKDEMKFLVSYTRKGEKLHVDSVVLDGKKIKLKK